MSRASGTHLYSSAVLSADRREVLGPRTSTPTSPLSRALCVREDRILYRSFPSCVWNCVQRKPQVRHYCGQLYQGLRGRDATWALGMEKVATMLMLCSLLSRSSLRCAIEQGLAITSTGIVQVQIWHCVPMCDYLARRRGWYLRAFKFSLLRQSWSYRSKLWSTTSSSTEF